jgi:hypothetical protein
VVSAGHQRLKTEDGRSRMEDRDLLSSILGLISQLFNLLLVHTEEVGNFMQYGQADLIPQLESIRKITQERLGEDGNPVREESRIKDGSFGQGSSFIKTIQHVSFGIETERFESPSSSFFLDDDLHVLKPALKHLGELI